MFLYVFPYESKFMRVIAGLAKGRTLISPKKDSIRPVLDQVKEAVFNILYYIEGLSVLDLFAGTGAVGIEALSRGAAHAVFVDHDEEAVKLIRKNLERCGFERQGKVLPMTVGKAINILSKKGEAFDLIFVDPPYLRHFVVKTLRKLAKSPLCGSQTQIIVEHHPKETIPEMEGLILTDQRKYGQTLVSFLSRHSERSEESPC